MISTFDWIKKYKETYPEKSWADINMAIRTFDTKPDDYRFFKSSEALRSWYRREKRKRETVTNPFDALRQSMQSLGNAMANSISSGIVTSSYIKNATQQVYGSIPDSMPIAFEPVVQLDLQSTLVLADLHCPYHDESYINTALNTIYDQYGSFDCIVIAGDLLDLDVISRHGKAHNIVRLETELEITGKMLLALADHAPIYITQGNHDSRFVDKLDTPLSFGRIISAALNGRQSRYPITTTERDYLFIGDHFVVGHLDKYSIIPGKLAYGIAQKYKRHALCGHDHLTGVFTGDPNAKYIGASIGCTADSSKFWYSERRLNSLPFMTKGYAFISGNEDAFTLHNVNHESYFERYVSNGGAYNMFKV